MKAYILLPFVLLAGLVIGGFGPRSELAKVRAELEHTRKLVTKPGGGAGGFAEVSSLLGIERAGKNSKTSEESAVSKSGKVDADSAAVAEKRNEGEVAAADEVEKSVSEDVQDRPEEAGDRPRRDFSEELDRAIELWQVRVDIAKSTFIANARLNDVQALQMETMLAGMNVRIGTTIDKFAEDVKDAEMVQPEAGIRLANSITEAMVITYDEMDRTLPSNWRRRAGQSFSLTDFVDPEVARPLAGLEGKIDRMVR